MRIGFMVPVDFALGNPGNGVTAQANAQAAALAKRGHEIVFLNPWQFQPEEELDVLHIFLGGLGTFGIQQSRQLRPPGLLVMAPIIDSNQPNWLYKLAVRAGTTIGKILTVPGVLAQQARACDIVLCRSEFERRRVTHGLGVADRRAVVVLNGGDVPFVSQDILQAVRTRYNLPEKFVLNVSAYTQDRKNILRLAAAAEQLNLPLVLAGHHEPNSIGNELTRQAQTNANLRLIGFVDRETRDALYGLCHVFCLPSYHEGTGLAALEAGAAGARVVITRCGGTRDYFGSYAQYVNPFATGEIRDAIAHEWNQPRNEKLADHVRTQLSWDASAENIERAYELGHKLKQANA